MEQGNKSVSIALGELLLDHSRGCQGQQGPGRRLNKKAGDESRGMPQNLAHSGLPVWDQRACSLSNPRGQTTTHCRRASQRHPRDHSQGLKCSPGITRAPLGPQPPRVWRQSPALGKGTSQYRHPHVPLLCSDPHF